MHAYAHTPYLMIDIQYHGIDYLLAASQYYSCCTRRALSVTRILTYAPFAVTDADYVMTVNQSCIT